MVEIGAVYVGPKDAVNDYLQHHAHGGGTLMGIMNGIACVKFNTGVKEFATAFAQQKPKLVKTNSEFGKTCLANVKAAGYKIVNKDDGACIGYVVPVPSQGWYFQHVKTVYTEGGFTSKHLAIKALVNYVNAQVDKADVESLKGLSATLMKHLSVVTPPDDPWATTEKKKKPQVAVAIPASTAWTSVKEEINGNQLVGANPQTNADGQIISGEIHYKGIALGYTASNFDGTMKVYHADGTLVAEKAVPGSHTATDQVAGYHSANHSGLKEKIAELNAKIKNTVVDGKIGPTEISQAEGGLHNQPHLSYAAPTADEIAQHFSHDLSNQRGNQVYDLVPGAHLLDIAGTWKYSLKHYTANGYGSINDQLRAGAIQHQATGNHIVHLDKIFTKTPELEEAIVIYRGIDKHAAVSLLGEVGSRVGDTFVELGFSSCSAFVSSAFTAGSNIIMRITVPKGAHVIKPSQAGHFGDKEREIILPREANFLVMRDEIIEKGSYHKRQIDLVFTGSAIN